MDTLNPISITNSTLRYNRHATTTNNDAFGAGLTIMRGDHLVGYTEIHDNSVATSYNGADVYGGGIDIRGGNSQILHSRIYNNSASTSTSATSSHGGGGGILIRAGGPLIQYCEITSNTLYTRRQSVDDPGAGAGIGIYGASTAQIRNNLISDNVNTSRGAAGGGIGFDRFASVAIIDSNVISGNIANHTGYAGEGAGIDAWNSNTFVASNNLIYNNTTNGQGGGVACWANDNCHFYNNTIVGNTAYQGGGIYSHRGLFYNNIVVGNTATNQGGGVYRSGGTVDYNDIYGNTAPSNSNSYGTIGSRNISLDPLFLGVGDLVQRYHLRQDSPAIEAGTNSLADLPNDDYDDQIRPVGTTWDMGFDEFAVLYSKAVDAAVASGGLELTYTIVVTNPGPYTDLIGAQVTDQLPANTAYSSGPNCNLVLCSYDSGTNSITWTGDIAAGSALTLDYTVLVNLGLADGTPITNQANIVAGRLSQVTNTATTVIYNPNLVVTKSASPEPVEAGDTLNYTIVIANTGLGPATGVVVSDPLPAHTQFVPNSIAIEPPGAGTAGAAPPTLATDVRIDAGQSVTISYAVVVDQPLDAGTSIPNVASVTSIQVPTPSTDEVNSTVSTTPLVAVAKTGPARTRIGETATFTFTVTNIGNTLLHNLEVQDDYAGPGAYVGGDDGDGWLGLTEAWIYSASYTIQPEDPDPLVNTVIVTATDALGTVTTASDTHGASLGPAGGFVYLPIIMGGATAELPDLVVEELTATSQAVSVTIRNQGSAAVNDAFWLDVYFDPSEIPGLNQPWDTIAGYGAVWGVTTSIPAGASLTLTTGGDYYFPEYSSPPPWPVGANVYALVDSVDFNTTYGAVLESNEDNNLFEPVTSTASVAGNAARIGGQSQPVSTEGLPPR